MNEFLIELQAKLNEAKSKGNINTDIDKIQSQIDKLKIQAEIDPKTISNLVKQLETVLNQKINISNINIDQSQISKSAKQVGQQIGQQISQGINNSVNSSSQSTSKILRNFSELNDVKRQFVDGHDYISKEDISDAEKFYDTVRKAFSEFGQVTVSKGEITDGVLDSMRVKIEQVNDEAKITRDFMLYLNQADNFGNSFKLADDDTIKSTEKMIQHLNEEKNIVNATGEEANAIKEKLAEQEKYYDKLEQASKEQLAIEKQRITAGEKQLEILDAQSKRRDSRISYNEGQINKKGLSDTAKQREINDLVYAGSEKLDVAFAKELDKNLSTLTKLKSEWQEQGICVDEFKEKVKELETALNNIDSGDIKGLNGIRQQIESLKTEASQIAEVNKIQLLSNGGIKDDYSTQIAKLEGNFRSLGLTEGDIQAKTSNVTKAFDTLKSKVNQPFDASNYQEIISLNDKLQKELIESGNEYTKLQSSAKGFVSVQQRLSKANTIEAWNQKNSAATKQVISANEAYIASLRDLNSQMTKMQFNEIADGFKKSENSMRSLGKLGASFKEQMSQAASSFTQWLSVSSAVMLLVSKTKNAITELKEVNTYLTEISKANDKLSKSDLTRIGSDSFSTASKYGKKSTDYLSGVQEASRAGYEDAEGIAELSVAAQGAGDMTADLSNQMIIATDKAYKMNGSVEKLTTTLDGMNYITNHNAVNMTELSEGMTVVGSTAASFNVEVNETTAALGTMIATTQQSGSEAARAFKAILLNIRQVSDEEEGIDAEGLTKYENACNALNVKLKETKNGVLSLRDPMEVLKELSVEYNKLDESDIRRTNLLSSVGGKLRATQLDALLRQWDTYEAMLQQFEDGAGSMAVEAEKTAKSWEGVSNRVANVWTSIVNNVANSDAIIAGTAALGNFLEAINKLTSSLGSLGTIGLGAGIFAGFKNVGVAQL